MFLPQRHTVFFSVGAHWSTTFTPFPKKNLLCRGEDYEDVFSLLKGFALRREFDYVLHINLSSQPEPPFFSPDWADRGSYQMSNKGKRVFKCPPLSTSSSRTSTPASATVTISPERFFTRKAWALRSRPRTAPPSTSSWPTTLHTLPKKIFDAEVRIMRMSFPYWKALPYEENLTKIFILT